MRTDFHTHTFLSDGQLHVTEHLRYAQTTGHNAIAITDHAGVTDAARTIDHHRKELDAVAKDFDLVVLLGVELTHVPPRRIPQAAEAAKKAGAQVVVVHGETLDEPVAKGTNAAAVRCADVDVLAHPGLIAAQDVQAAAETGVFLELTPRRVHCHTNGHVARLAIQNGAKLVVNSDAHMWDDLLSEERARRIVLGSGLTDAYVDRVLTEWPRELLKRSGAL